MRALRKGLYIIMDYLYFLANASLTLRVIQHLRCIDYLSQADVTVVHQIDGWVLKIRLHQLLTPKQHGDFQAFMVELGIPYQPNTRLKMVFDSLNVGQSPIAVMRRYQVSIVSHGRPDTQDIEAFKQQFTRGLGYCPETLA